MKNAAYAAMLIRKPVSEVFEAIVNPDITTKFWFTKSTRRIEKGKELTWTWEMYDASTNVTVLELEQNKRILLEWGEPEERTQVEWLFTEKNGGTFLEITDSGYSGTDEELTTKIADSTGGFSLVTAGLKAYLEHGIQLGLVGDRYPK